jgi:hypothetical protein
MIKVSENRLGGLVGEVNTLGSPVTAIELRELTCQHLPSRSPRGDHTNELRDVLDAGHPDLPGNVPGSDPPTFDQTASLIMWVSPLDSAPNAPPEKEPVNLLSKLLRGRRETDPEATRLLPGSVTVCLEEAEDQVADNLGRDIGDEESGRDLLDWCQAAIDLCPAAEFENAILLAWPMRISGCYLLARRLGLASKSAGDLSRVSMQSLCNVDELNRRLAPDVAVTDEIPQQPCVVWRNRLSRAKA